MTYETACLVVVDWGTTSLRAYLTDNTGKILADIETEEGIRTVQDQDFEAVLMTVIGPWLEQAGAIPVVALGMITSRNGWIEVPYVPCPATLGDLAKGALKQRLPNGSELLFLAGITDTDRTPFPDVMRGEETQIIGFGDRLPSVLVLPGTHSKWARTDGARIEGFQTFVTGEIFALLSQHSFIASIAGGAFDAFDEDAFKRGVEVAKSTEGHDDAFLTQIFSTRTGMLANALEKEELFDYLSGLLIGCEFKQARAGGWIDTGAELGIVGNDGLNDRYEIAAQHFGCTVVHGGEHAAILGAVKVVNARASA